MSLHNLKPAEGSVKSGKRIARGEGSGKGGTSTRGHNGAKSRSGYSRKIGFEGGQMPLHRRLPKHGFNNIFRKEYTTVGIDVIQKAIDSGKIDPNKKIDVEVLKLNGVIKKVRDGLKLLGNGSIKSKVDIEVAALTTSAKEAIEKVDGNVSILVRKVKEKKESVSTSS